MKYLKKFNNHSLYEAYLVSFNFIETEGKDVVSFCKQQNEVHYNIIIYLVITLHFIFMKDILVCPSFCPETKCEYVTAMILRYHHSYVLFDYNILKER